MPKLLRGAEARERVWTFQQFIAAIVCFFMPMLEKIVMMCETITFFHNPRTNYLSKQWVDKGKPGPIKTG
jgi:hypothetical protein